MVTWSVDARHAQAEQLRRTLGVWRREVHRLSAELGPDAAPRRRAAVRHLTELLTRLQRTSEVIERTDPAAWPGLDAALRRRLTRLHETWLVAAHGTRRDG